MKIEVLETTLRDGVQGEGVSLSMEDKLQLISLFDELGLDYIEAGTPFSNPGDKYLLCDAPPSTAASQLVAFGTTRYKTNLIQEDLSLKVLASSKTQIVSVVGKSDITQVEKVLSVTLSENLKMIYDSIRYLCDKGKRVFFDAEHFFDGLKENPEYAIETLRVAKNAGAELLVLCDTNGAALPDEIYAAVKKISKALRRVKIGIHCHNDLGLAVANTMAAVDGGATHIQGTFLGFGERCGNCNLSTAILNLQLKKGYEILPADKIARFTEAASRIAEIANMPLPSYLPYVGRSAFSHKGGMHSDGVLKYPPAFEHISPDTVGNERRFLLSDIAGRAAFQKKAAELFPDIEFTSATAGVLLEDLKQLEMQGYAFEGADASFYLFVKRSLGLHTPRFQIPVFKVSAEEPSVGDSATAEVTAEVGGAKLSASASGNGPVNALDAALRRAIVSFFPIIDKVTLTDYKVRVINSEAATKAKVRVLITSAAFGKSWTTVGVSSDVIEASKMALSDALEYFLDKTDKE